MSSSATAQPHCPHATLPRTDAAVRQQWFTLGIGILLCAVPTWIWLYRRPTKPNVSQCGFRPFVGYHVFTVMAQMVWQTLHSAATWSLADLIAFSRPFYMLVAVYLTCWTAAMIWSPGSTHARAGRKGRR
jgi:hypothetical protein